MRSVDLNCDMGESFGAWKMGRDAELMRIISSANVACGYHAGDASTMRRTVELALENGVAVGAHPSYPDLQGFGRREMSLPPKEVFDIVLHQVAALKGICEALGGRLAHVKPHGALYNRSAKDPEIASAIAEAVKTIDAGLILFGLSGSTSVRMAEDAGLKTASEVFADRTYMHDGSLTPRSTPNALITDTEAAAAQAVSMVRDGIVRATDGSAVSIRADTICIHGDGPHALEFANAVRSAMDRIGVSVSAVAPARPAKI